MVEQKKSGSVLSKIREICYFILLPWPIYVLLSYMVLSGAVKTTAIFTMFAVEIILGVFISLVILKRIQESNKLSSKIHLGIIVLSLLIYAITAGGVVVSVLSSF